MRRIEKGYFQSSGGFDQNTSGLERFDKSNRGSDTFRIILKGLEITLRANMDILISLWS
jgi:hypothetical protein